MASWWERVPAIVVVVALFAITVSAAGPGGSDGLSDDDPFDLFQMFVSNVTEEHLEVLRSATLSAEQVQAWWDHWSEQYDYEYGNIEEVIGFYLSDELFSGEPSESPGQVAGDVAFAHAIAQSGWFQSEGRVDGYNYAGVRLWSGGGSFETYDSVQEGIRGHFRAIYEHHSEGDDWRDIVSIWNGDDGTYWDNAVGAVYGSMLEFLEEDSPTDTTTTTEPESTTTTEPESTTTTTEPSDTPTTTAGTAPTTPPTTAVQTVNNGRAGEEITVSFADHTWPIDRRLGYTVSASGGEVVVGTPLVSVGAYAEAMADGLVVNSGSITAGCPSGIVLEVETSDSQHVIRYYYCGFSTDQFLYSDLSEILLGTEPPAQVQKGDNLGSVGILDSITLAMQIRDADDDTWHWYCPAPVLDALGPENATEAGDVTLVPGSCQQD